MDTIIIAGCLVPVTHFFALVTQKCVFFFFRRQNESPTEHVWDVEFSRLGSPKRYEYACEVLHKLSKSKSLSSAQSYLILTMRSYVPPKCVFSKIRWTYRVVVHSYVELRMYLLHEFCTKPKFRESCFFTKARFRYYTTQKNTRVLLLEIFKGKRDEKKPSPPPPRH